MITFKDLVTANKTISTVKVQNRQYAEVAQRVKAFRCIQPNGAIVTEMLSNDGGVCIFKATVYDDEGKILGTGTAYEKENSTFINKTSYIENCETSAVGRALGMCGFGIDVAIASAEEVMNAIANQGKSMGGKGGKYADIYRQAEEVKNFEDLSAIYNALDKSTQDAVRDEFNKIAIKKGLKNDTRTQHNRLEV